MSLSEAQIWLTGSTRPDSSILNQSRVLPSTVVQSPLQFASQLVTGPLWLAGQAVQKKVTEEPARAGATSLAGLALALQAIEALLTSVTGPFPAPKNDCMTL